ncbi:MAG: OsmC family protein, partial [Pseudorhodobacter sp.]|nr:OsmC family protein [Frankiaceae bacterium]
TGTAPSPTELFVASLASCVAFYARRYLQRHDLRQDGLVVTAQATSGAKPSRVASMTITLTLPDGVPEDKRQALLAVASHCTVHNTLTHPPDVLVQLAG